MGAYSTFKGTLNAPSITSRLAFEILMAHPIEMGPTHVGRSGRKVSTDAFLETPNRPGAH
jgi:hypothetical protein